MFGNFFFNRDLSSTYKIENITKCIILNIKNVSWIDIYFFKLLVSEIAMMMEIFNGRLLTSITAYPNVNSGV